MSRVVLQNVTGRQPAHKLPTFYGTHFHVQMRPPFVPVLIQVNPVHILPPYPFKISLIITLTCISRHQSNLFPSISHR